MKPFSQLTRNETIDLTNKEIAKKFWAKAEGTVWPTAEEPAL